MDDCGHANRSFNPLQRGMGIRGTPNPPPPRALPARFNPLQRGMGIRGSDSYDSYDSYDSVSIPFNGAWVFGGHRHCRPGSRDRVSIPFNGAWVFGALVFRLTTCLLRSFNPLQRGMGIRGSTNRPQRSQCLSVSIPFNGAWVFGVGVQNPDDNTPFRFQSPSTGHGYSGLAGPVPDKREVS